jgi:hypothetical protein
MAANKNAQGMGISPSEPKLQGRMRRWQFACPLRDSITPLLASKKYCFRRFLLKPQYMVVADFL